jgi:hypothetical protein
MVNDIQLASMHIQFASKLRVPGFLAYHVFHTPLKVVHLALWWCEKLVYDFEGCV